MANTLSSYSKKKPMSGMLLGLMVLLAVGLGCFYRMPDLGLRPMHTDEAIHAVKFVELSKTGRFDYDPSDFHGPVLHYLTWCYGTVAGWKDAAMVSEADLRRVVAVLGILLILSTLLVTDALGRLATGMAMLFMAVSPMEVFYSRYYIMEVPFVLWLALFIFSCWRYSVRPRWGWLILAGVSIGLLHPTKETFVLNLVAMVCGWVAAKLLTEGFEHRGQGMLLSIGRNRKFIQFPWLWGTLIAVGVSVMLFSGFFRFWDDVGQSVTTYGSYVNRSGGAGHEKPWHYYLTLMFYRKDTFVWTEAGIGVLAIIGVLYSFFGRFQREEARRAFLIFLSTYSLVALAIYSVIPYKTPWTFLSVQHVLILLAGVGAQCLLGFSRSFAWRLIWAVLMLGGLYHLCAQSMYTIRDRGQANLRGPYIYSHTTTNAMKLVQKLKELAAFKGEGFSAQVINIDSGWPLPWYLRNVPSIGYQTQVPETVDAPVIVVDADLATSVQSKLQGKSYESDIFGLRPGVNVVLLVEKSLADAYRASKTAAP